MSRAYSDVRMAIYLGEMKEQAEDYQRTGGSWCDFITLPL